MKIKDIIDYIETFAPLDTAMDFDNCGLLVGSEDEEITAATLALDITDSVIDEAVRNGSELIISHHPVIFEPLKKLPKDSPVYRLARNDLSALCMHTNLDLSPIFGVNTCLAEAVGIKEGDFVAGECLYIGRLEEETTVKSFAESVKRKLSCKGLRYTVGDKRVRTVAICSGSGGDLAPLAKAHGADVLLTGEIKHHEILDAGHAGIAIIDAGHFKTEDIVISPLRDRLSKEFRDIKFYRSTTCTDAVEYC